MTLARLLEQSDNDYGDSLALAIARALQPSDPCVVGAPPGTDVSVVIAGYNERSTIKDCLRSVARSAAVAERRTGVSTEILYVDDGSTDGTLEEAARVSTCTPVELHHIEHSGQSVALNAGAGLARSRLVVFCDADIALSETALTGLISTTLLDTRNVYVGFREHLRPRRLRRDLPVTMTDSETMRSPRFSADNRVLFDHPGWPRSMFLESNAFRDFGFGRCLSMPGGQEWDLPRLVHGFLFCVERARFIDVGGFDTQVTKGWGFNDTFLAARLIGWHGCKIVPVPNATGFHLGRLSMSESQKRSGNRNHASYVHALSDPAVRARWKPIVPSPAGTTRHCVKGEEPSRVAGPGDGDPHRSPGVGLPLASEGKGMTSLTDVVTRLDAGLSEAARLRHVLGRDPGSADGLPDSGGNCPRYLRAIRHQLSGNTNEAVEHLIAAAERGEGDAEYAIGESWSAHEKRAAEMAAQGWSTASREGRVVAEILKACTRHREDLV